MSQEIKFQFRFCQCRDNDESENSSQLRPNDSSQSNEQAGHESSEKLDGPDNSSQTSSQTTDSGGSLSENSQETPKYSQETPQNSRETPQNSRETPQNSQSQKCVISPFVNLKRLDPADLGMTLEDFENLSKEILNKSFGPDGISSQSSQDEK